MAVVAVDDDISMLTLVEVLLARKGYSVVTALGAEALLQSLDRLVADIFILDIMMPNINGVELCKMLRSDPRTMVTPIIIFSSYGNNDIVKLCLDAGANAYLAKSNLTRLPALVNDLLSMEPEAQLARGKA